MTKILLLIIVVAVAVAWFRARSRQGGPPPAAPGVPPGTSASTPLGERMVTCAQCGLNLPSGEAVFDAAGTAYCGAPHLEAQRARERR